MIILSHELEISTIYIEKLPAKPTIAISSSIISNQKPMILMLSIKKKLLRLQRI
jgi:hypothetical protein